MELGSPLLLLLTASVVSLIISGSFEFLGHFSEFTMVLTQAFVVKQLCIRIP